MKPWLRRTLIGVFGASLLATAFAAGACRGHHGWGTHAMSEEDAARMKTRMVDKLGSKLDLDAAQKARLGTLADRLHEQRRALVGASDPRSDIASLVSGPAFDRAKAQALVEAKTSAVSTKSPELIAALGDFYDSLRPEQQQKVRDFMNRGGRHGWHG